MDIIEEFKTEYASSALKEDAMSERCIELFDAIMGDYFSSHEEMDELITEIREEYGYVQKTPEQLKIEELEAKLNALLAKG